MNALKAGRKVPRILRRKPTNVCNNKSDDYFTIVNEFEEVQDNKRLRVKKFKTEILTTNTNAYTYKSIKTFTPLKMVNNLRNFEPIKNITETTNEVIISEIENIHIHNTIEQIDSASQQNTKFMDDDVNDNSVVRSLFNRVDYVDSDSVKDNKPCHICPKELCNCADFNSKNTNLSHVCEICKKSFYRAAYLKRHLNMAHKPSNISRVPCEICGKTFKSKYNYQQHALIHSGVRNYECKICSKRFTQVSSLGAHMKFHSGIKDVCPVCGLPTTRLNEHMRTHTGERPYKCQTCGRTFTTSSQRKNHYVTHTKVKNYICEICNSKFAQLSSLYKHRNTIHGNHLMYQCNDCQKSFNRRDNLKAHVQTVHINGRIKNAIKIEEAIQYFPEIRIHNEREASCNVYAYHCAECDTTFKENSSLNRHKNATHCKTQKLVCSFCDELFFDKREYICHCKHSHSVKVILPLQTNYINSDNDLGIGGYCENYNYNLNNLLENESENIVVIQVIDEDGLIIK